jgi:hypothetical protein
MGNNSGSIKKCRLCGTPRGRRKKGRPRLRWLDDVEDFERERERREDMED